VAKILRDKLGTTGIHSEEYDKRQYVKDGQSKDVEAELRGSEHPGQENPKRIVQTIAKD
jgi:hypothetical protein